MKKPCEYCQAIFEAKRSITRFCSRSCAGKWKAKAFPLPKTCFQHGDSPWNKGTNKSGMLGKNVSPETRARISKAKKKDNPKSTANKLARVSPEYKIWRNGVFLRDGFKCTACGSTKKLHPHHLKSFAKFVDLRFDVNNGITLCEVCHGKVHGMDFSICRRKIVCEYCGKLYAPKDGHYKRKTCSNECKYKLMATRPSKTKGVPRPHTCRARVDNCLACGVEFRAVKDTKKRKQKYCSFACYLKARWGYVANLPILEATGEPFPETPQPGYSWPDVFTQQRKKGA